MYAIASFLENYYYGGGIGLWFFFFMVALIAAVYIFYDGSRREKGATAFWRIAIIVVLLLFIPSMLFRFTVKLSDIGGYFSIQAIIDRLVEFQDVVDWRVQVENYRQQLLENFPTLTGYFEIIAYLGVFALVAAIGLAVGYWLTFKDQPFGEGLPVAPDRRIYTPPPVNPPVTPRVDYPVPRPQPDGPAYAPTKPKANAWLVMKSNGKSYQLNRGTTIIGRSPRCDIQVINDTTVSKEHVKIMEARGHFTLADLASTNGTWINGHRVRQPVLLDANDEIRLGDNTYLKFVAS
jgi:hypothetical protein